MSPVQSRKRRRAVAFGSTEDTCNEPKVASKQSEEVDLVEEPAEPAEDMDQNAQVWEAFREEYYEVLEQLPLTLHRSFALVRELDEQANEHNNVLLQSLLNYVEHRKSLQTGAEQENVRSENVTTTTTQTSSRKTPQELLSNIAWLAEEVVRASQEKVNVAQSAYDSADRQIRLLDFAIKEQETSITLGLKHGAPLLPILSDATVGRWVRPPCEPQHVEQIPSDIAGVVQTAPAEGDESMTLGVVAPDNTENVQSPTIFRRGKKGRGKKRVSNANSVATAPAPSALTVTVPPLASLQTADMPVDPNEPRYCYCHQVSFGEMIACDNTNCELEWFHLGCAGLAEAPKGKWYCSNCQTIMKTGSRKGR